MYSSTLKVIFSHIGEDGTLRLYELSKWFTDISIAHSESIGIGMEYLNPRHLAWLLTSWQIEIHRLPEYNESIRIETWPFDFRGAFGYRNYRILSDSDEVLVTGYAIWLHTNVEKMLPARVLEEEVNLYGGEEKLPMEYQPRKIEMPEDMTEVTRMQVAPHYADMYRHLNNSMYIDIASDYLKGQPAPNRILADYRKQFKVGEEVIIKTSLTDGQLYVGFYDTNDDLHVTVAFRLETEN